jgi:hypothetical protein
MPRLNPFNYSIPAYVKICKRGRPPGNRHFRLLGPSRPLPGTQVGQGTLYNPHSMLRETKQDTPSLTVWDEGGKWIDRGGPNSTGIHGGSIVQLGLAYWPGLSFVEVLGKIKETCDRQESMVPAYKPVKYPTEQEHKGYTFELVRTQPIGRNFVLTKYLEGRGILDIAHGYMQEIYYRNRLEIENKSIFYAIGWKKRPSGLGIYQCQRLQEQYRQKRNFRDTR